MAYIRKAARQDIRSLVIKPSEINQSFDSDDTTPKQEVPLTFHHQPVKEFGRILLVVLPLAGVLAIASYWDRTHHWVIPAANWLLKFGS